MRERDSRPACRGPAIRLMVDHPDPPHSVPPQRPTACG